MNETKAPRGLVRFYTITYLVLAGASIVAGIVQLVIGREVGWLLILFGPMLVLLGNLRVYRLHASYERRSRSE